MKCSTSERFCQPSGSGRDSVVGSWGPGTTLESHRWSCRPGGGPGATGAEPQTWAQQEFRTGSGNLGVKLPISGTVPPVWGLLMPSHAGRVLSQQPSVHLGEPELLVGHGSPPTPRTH